MKLRRSSTAQKDEPALRQRLRSLQRRLTAGSFDACFIDSPLDLLYFTGLKLSAGYLIATRDSASLFVDGRYIQMAQEKAPLAALLEGEGKLEAYLKKERVKKLGFDSRHVSYDRFLQLQKRCKAVKLSFIPDGHFFEVLRALKQKEEIDKMRKSAALNYQGFLYIRKLLKKGITEREVARKFEIFCLENGAEKLSFEPIIAFGANSAMPHYRSQLVPLQPGDLVLIDIGIVLDQYHSDMTRVLFFERRDPFFEHIYDVVFDAQRAALAVCRSGVHAEELDLAARKVMRKAKLEPHFLHSLGHGIGLETHEFPRLSSRGKDRKTPLRSGMAITVEPGLYFPGKGGIRYEDTVVVTSSGYESFYPGMDHSELIVKSSRGKK